MVTVFDISEQGIEKAKRLAEYNQVTVNFFKADLFDYHPSAEYDINVSSRKYLCKNHVFGINRWFFWQKRVCHKTSHQVDHKIAAASVSGMFHLTNIF